jgi:hypothetical protein
MQFKPLSIGNSISAGRKGPRLIEKKMRKKKNGLNNHNKNDDAFFSRHYGLDSLPRHSDGICVSKPFRCQVSRRSVNFSPPSYSRDATSSRSKLYLNRQ